MYYVTIHPLNTSPHHSSSYTTTSVYTRSYITELHNLLFYSTFRAYVFLSFSFFVTVRFASVDDSLVCVRVCARLFQSV